MLPTTRRSAVFAKEPLPGKVKTRLIPALGAEGAAELQRAMLADILELHRVAGAPLDMVVAPAAAVERMKVAYPDAQAVLPQVGVDLGERLDHWFASGAPDCTTVVIGADCPLIDAATVARAHELLESGVDAVFAPDGGGGYGLVGLRAPSPGVFQVAPLSTEDNFVRTVDEILRRGLKVELLPQCYDVDEPRDLERLMRDLNSSARNRHQHHPQRTAALLMRRIERSGAPN